MIEDPNLSPFGDKYLEQTQHLDRYGNEIEIESCDLTEQSDYAYEMSLDDIIYKN